MNPIGIMQGRLSPAPPGRAQTFPADWRGEFAAAAACGLTAIEWLVPSESVIENPLFSDRGIDEIHRAAGGSGVAVTTLCADCFVTEPLLRVAASRQRAALDRLEHILVAAARAGIATVVLPVIEAGAVHDRSEMHELLRLLRDATTLAAAGGIRLALETDLDGDRLRAWLAAAPPAVGACYDIGNAAAAGGDPAADIRALGARLGAVHVKDRRRGGSSVPLGAGDADFAGAFGALAAIGYRGPLILETPAGGDPLASAAAHVAFVRAHLAAATDAHA